MPSILPLPPLVADLIAAGEVVERPASAARELCENAADAGATAVTVEVQGGGVRYLRVTDNGSGLSEEDLRAAFLPHATSKLRTANDLDAIQTLGFRGEALASIAAVARVELLTRQPGHELGFRYVVEGGTELLLEETGCPIGSTFLLRDLFFHTPARLKFLKKDTTEAALVCSVVERFALAQRHIAVTMIREGRCVFQSPGDGSEATTVRMVLGKAFYEELVPLPSSPSNPQEIHVSGFVSSPQFTRPNRNHQSIFLNGRFIKCPTALAALSEAVRALIPTGKHPACVLFLTVPPALVDVNVHPAKTEVRFANEHQVFQAVYTAVRSAVSVASMPASGGSRSEVDSVAAPASVVVPGAVFAPSTPDPMPFRREIPAYLPSVLPPKATSSMLRDPSASDPGTPSSYAYETVSLPEVPHPVLPQQLSLTEFPTQSSHPEVLGELFETYFLVTTGDAFLLIDKHAAHERILYDALKENAEQGRRQVLLTPLPLNLSREESAILREQRVLLLRAGFCLEDFGVETLLLRECPLLLTGVDLEEQLREIAGYLLSGKEAITTEAEDWIFHSAACRAAVKAGDPCPPEERTHFVRDLLTRPELQTCPHGRPIFLRLTQAELEKKFSRI